jgi:protoporphyrinogen oxidase
MDIGGHRFFSKSDRVMNWWQRQLPAQGAPSIDDQELGRPSTLQTGGPDPSATDTVMLVRQRLSRILFERKFYDYPISPSLSTFANLGVARVARMGASYLAARARPARKEDSLEDFMINRFGYELYATFFRDYTQKVWGVPCGEIKPEWGAQRIKGLSVASTLWHAAKKLLPADRSLSQKSTETSLIERFLYPKFGPGQLWEHVAKQVQDLGGEVRMHHSVTRFERDDTRITAVHCQTPEGDARVACDYVLSSMPIIDLVAGLPEVPATVRRVASGLRYRDFITVGLQLSALKIRNATTIPTAHGLIPDNWIYVQDRDVQLGRIQVFNNWSPYLVADRSKVWLGLEYFCNEGDALWSMSDSDMLAFAARELQSIGVADPRAVEDGTVVRVPKTYPAYFGTYDELPVVRAHLDAIANLWCIGRNGQHRYNNMDHSMLTAMESVSGICDGIRARDHVWAVNTEKDYHEERDPKARSADERVDPKP